MAMTEIDGVTLEGYSELMRLLGLKFTRLERDGVEGSFRAGPEHHHPWGMVHGGLYTAVVETAATTGAFLSAREHGQRAVGVTNICDFLRPIAEGELRFRAAPVHQGRTQQLWQVVIERLADGKAIARGQLRLQNVEG